MVQKQLAKNCILRGSWIIVILSFSSCSMWRDFNRFMIGCKQPNCVICKERNCVERPKHKRRDRGPFWDNDWPSDDLIDDLIETYKNKKNEN